MDTAAAATADVKQHQSAGVAADNTQADSLLVVKQAYVQEMPAFLGNLYSLRLLRIVSGTTGSRHAEEAGIFHVCNTIHHYTNMMTCSSYLQKPILQQ